MQTCTPAPDSDTPGFDRRRFQRRRIWDVLHGICSTLEQVQETEDGRLACREVAHAISQARLRESLRNSPGKA